MGKFVTIGERLSTTAPAVNKAFLERDPEPILKRAKQQLDAGATYLDVNIGPAEGYGPDLMKWAVELLQGEFDNVPLALDTSMLQEESKTSTLQLQTMQSLLHCVTAKVLQKTTMSVWVTARCFWKEVWNMVWKQKICGSIRSSW